MAIALISRWPRELAVIIAALSAQMFNVDDEFPMHPAEIIFPENVNAAAPT